MQECAFVGTYRGELRICAQFVLSRKTVVFVHFHTLNSVEEGVSFLPSMVGELSLKRCLENDEYWHLVWNGAEKISIESPMWVIKKGQ